MKNTVHCRVELWKDYRKEIEENIALQQSVRNSNEKLQILYERLLKVFPNYEKKYASKLQSFKINLEKIEEPPIYSLKKIEEIIFGIEEIEKNQIKSPINFDDLDFSSKILDSIITTINKGTNKQKLQEKKQKVSQDVIIKKSQTVFLKKPKTVNFSVAIDGPSGAGKSTIARKLANKWNLFYLNTGLVYRAIALKTLISNVEANDKKQIALLLKPNMIKLHHDETVELDNKDVTLEIRSDEVSQLASKISTLDFVRDYALEIQKKYANRNNVIAEGRDTTFRLLPNAEIKIYLDTLPQVRAQRRVSQNAQLGYNTNYDEILEEIIERDERDKNRKIDPLHQTADAFYIDASYLSVEEVIEKINHVIYNHLNIKNHH